jgi:protein gp37
MADNSKIAWTDATVNFWWGCTKVGPGCDHCYAETLSKRLGEDVWGAGKSRRKIKGAVALMKKLDNQCSEWNADYEVRSGNAKAFGLSPPNMTGPTRRVFSQSMSDLFDNEIPEDWRNEALHTIEKCDRIDVQIVTKRISNVWKMVPISWVNNWPKHVWLIVTVCNQDEMNRDGPRLKHLKEVSGMKVAGFSIEPLLGPITSDWFGDWTIVGGESGPGFRPMQIEWAESIRAQCEATGTAFFFKQDHGQRSGMRGRASDALWACKQFPECRSERTKVETDVGAIVSSGSGSSRPHGAHHGGGTTPPISRDSSERRHHSAEGGCPHCGYRHPPDGGCV